MRYLIDFSVAAVNRALGKLWTEICSLKARVLLLEQAISGGGDGLLLALPFTTDHLSATNNPYLIGNLVYYLGNVYRCIANNDSILPTNASYWINLGAGFPLVQQPSDWNSTSGNNQILNKPSIIALVEPVQGIIPISGTIPVADGVTVISNPAWVGRNLLVLRDGFRVPPYNPGTGAMYYTKLLGSGTLTLSLAVSTGEDLFITVI